MFAVIKTGGKQYRVAAEDVITIERLSAQAGESVTFAEVLMISNGDAVHVGAPVVEGATVLGEVVDLTRAKKVIAFKKRRRQNSKRKRGHRQDQMTVRILEILAAGEKPSGAKKAAARKPAKAKVTEEAQEAAAAPADTASEEN